MMLSELKSKIEEMADDRFAPKPLCWIENHRDGEQSDSYYCPECAQSMIGWLLGGKMPKKILANKYANHPQWEGLRQEDLSYTNTRGSYEAGGCEHCKVCLKHLSVCLTYYGVISEIEHFESTDFSTSLGSKDFWHWLNVLDAIDYNVESGNFPSWRTASEKAKNIKIYNRALEVTKRMIGMPEMK